MTEAVIRDRLEQQDGFTIYDYHKNDSRKEPENVRVVFAPGLMEGMQEGGIADQVARQWVKGTGMRVFGFDPSGSFESANRTIKDVPVGYTFEQLTSDITEVGKLAVAEEPDARLLLIGHSLGGAAIIRAAASLPQIEQIVLLQTPHDATGHAKTEKRYAQFKYLVERRDGMLMGIRYGEGVLDSYLKMGSVAVLLSKLVEKGIAPPVTYIVSTDDELINHEPILDIPNQIPPGIPLDLVVVNGVRHGDNDERAVQRLIEPAMTQYAKNGHDGLRERGERP